MTSPWFTKTDRLANWQGKLNQVFFDWVNKPFVWGESDCFCFAAECVYAQTGQHPMQGFIGTYDSKKEAYAKILKGIKDTDGLEYKADGIAGYISLFMGESKPAGMAKRGDVVLVQTADMTVTCVVDDTGKRLVAMTENNGLVRLPFAMGVLAWSV